MAAPLDNRVKDMVLDVLRRYKQISSAVVFGSYAKGSQKPASDIDIALWGNLDFLTQARIAHDLDLLPFPYRFDTTVFERIENNQLKEHINRVGQPLYRAKS